MSSLADLDGPPLDPRSLLRQAKKCPWLWRLPDCERARFELVCRNAPDPVATGYSLALALDAEARRANS